MTRGGERKEAKEWLSRFSVLKGHDLAHEHNSLLQSKGSSRVDCDNSVSQATRDQDDCSTIITDGLGLRSQHLLFSAAEKDSAQYMPPHSHPKTRSEMLAQIKTWFNNKQLQELLMWINGDAGAGKSGVVQTFAEYLCNEKKLGASIFICRQARRNNPHYVFLTVAQQLSIRIEEYREFIIERLKFDPELPNKEMKAQFAALIEEPFGEKKIKASDRWGILLDGLDELETKEAQCEIIRLTTEFASKYRDSPLAWIITSRREPHISETFALCEDESYMLYCLPTNSTEACEEVERFFRSSFETTQRKYRKEVPTSWPSYTEFLTLATAASGLLVYAEAAMQFINHPGHVYPGHANPCHTSLYQADPIPTNPAQVNLAQAGPSQTGSTHRSPLTAVSLQLGPVERLERLVSIIGQTNETSKVVDSGIHLDALYKEALSSIPPDDQPLAQQLLTYIVYAREIQFGGYVLPQSLQTLRGMAILFDFPRIIHPCLLTCYSTLKASDTKVAHKKSLTCIQLSFANYLKDRNRSEDFYVGDAPDVTNLVALRVLRLWNNYHKDNEGSTWHEYCSKRDDETPSRGAAKFHTKLFRDIVICTRSLVHHILYRPVEMSVYELCKVNMIKLCYSFDARDLWYFVNTMVDQGTHFSNSPALLRQGSLQEVIFENLDWKDRSPAYAHYKKWGKSNLEWVLRRPRSKNELRTHVSELRDLQTSAPELPVFIFGGIYKARVAAFQYTFKDRLHRYIVPYHG